VKRLIITLTVLGVVLLALVLGVLYGIGYYLSPQDELAKSDAIVAISGGETDTRALEAIKLYEAGWAPKIIFSGAAEDTSGPSNAEAMKRLAMQQGVPAENILIEEISANTAQNAAAVAVIVKQRGYKQVILVTSPYHQRRAKILFEAALEPDTEVLNHSATDGRWRRSEWWSNDYSYSITMAELQKSLFLQLGSGRGRSS
jgi:uncharacterized SAM-binding protein YcdF (DUF218 family)